MPEAIYNAHDPLPSDRDRAAPEWVHLLTWGRNEARDGRVFHLNDPKAVHAAFAGGGVDLPIDYHHQHDAKASSQSGSIPAAGWIKELRLEGAKLTGRVDWTAQAAKLIADKAFRYLSHVIQYIPGGAVQKLSGAGLVHNPALHLTALANEETGMNDLDEFVAALVELLGLPDDTSAPDLLASVRSMMKDAAGRPAKAGRPPHEETATASVSAPDPAKYVPIETFMNLIEERNTFTASMAQERAVAKVAQAVQSGHITPGMRDWATALCASDEASFDKFLTSTPAQFAHLTKPVVYGKQQGVGPMTDAEEEAICKQLGLKPEQLGH